jgi:4-diphosphocytidyl-2-C-methyl-D-erythritol kinase
MKTAEAFAPAKINLTLHVTGQRADGYHLLDSLVVFADLGDKIFVRRSKGLSLHVTGPMAVGVPTDDSNLVTRAARMVGVADAEITLDKHLPNAAGIGGGSSDAAATLKALTKTHGVALPEEVLALGADVPVCLGARPARMTGIGEQAVPVNGLPRLPAVLVNPGVALSTPAVFAALADKNGSGMPQMPAFPAAGALIHWLSGCRNDLEQPALQLQPVVGQILAELTSAGAALARMSGSGATCFGLCVSEAEAHRLAETVASAHPTWWVKAVMLGVGVPDSE